MKPTPSKTYEGLLLQFNSLVTLFNLTEDRCVELSRKDYSLSEARLKALEEALESERAMNHQLTLERTDETF